MTDLMDGVLKLLADSLKEAGVASAALKRIEPAHYDALKKIEIREQEIAGLKHHAKETSNKLKALDEKAVKLLESIRAFNPALIRDLNQPQKEAWKLIQKAMLEVEPLVDEIPF